MKVFQNHQVHYGWKTAESYLVQRDADDGLHGILLAWLPKQFHVDHPQTLPALSMVGPEREAKQTQEITSPQTRSRDKSLLKSQKIVNR